MKSKLVRIIEENLTRCSIVPIPRQQYSEANGLADLESYAVKEDIEAIKVAVSGKYLCVASFAALMSYVGSKYDTDFGLNSMRIKVQATEGVMLIDYGSIRNLELIVNLKEPKSHKTLLGKLPWYRFALLTNRHVEAYQNSYGLQTHKIVDFTALDRQRNLEYSA